MSSVSDFWQGLSRAGRTGLVGGTLLILVAFVLATWLALRLDYQVLFSDLKPQDAQAMTTELDRLKIPYRIGDDGASILVDKATVHATRIKLMGKELPLHGAVGLELFNNTDFGMTEFAQKINYQRALQGELTRTIQSLSEVREVRVLLALPEQGLFKQAASKAKASITLVMRQGQALRTEQVTGIQRLVAAAVPGMTTQEVTIVDGHGVALTRSEGPDGDPGGSTARLDLKRDTENYLSRKVSAILDQTFGAGQALASVDVTLNMDQIRTTTEDVLPAAARGGLQAAGVVVKEREVLREAGSSADARIDGSALRNGSSQRDVDYAVGRRVEQVVSQPGSVRRIQVVAVVRQALRPAQEDSLKRLIAAAVGASPERGDTVVLHSIIANAGVPADAMAMGGMQADASSVDAQLPAQSNGVDWEGELRRAAPLVVILGLALAVVAWLWSRARGDAAKRTPTQTSAAPLNDAERAAALRRIQDWMAGAPLDDLAATHPPMQVPPMTRGGR